jgi:hypothetical protein
MNSIKSRNKCFIGLDETSKKNIQKQICLIEGLLSKESYLNQLIPQNVINNSKPGLFRV